MQRLQGPCAQINQIDDQLIQKSLSGKWMHFTRVSIVKADASFYALSLSLFDRIAAFFARLIGKDYLASKVQAKKVEICDRAVLEKIKRATPQTPLAANLPPAASVAANPPAVHVAANSPAAAPANNPVFTIPRTSTMQTFHFDLRQDPNQLTAITNALRNAPQVEIVILQGDLIDADPAALTAFSDSLASLPNLKDITIQCLMNVNKVPQLLNGLSRCPRLAQVILNVNECLQTLALEAIQRIQSLTTLEVNMNATTYRTGLICQKQAQNVLANMLRNHSSLNTLVLRGFDFNLPAGDQTCQNSYRDFMNALEQNRTVDRLEIDQSAISVPEAESLGGAMAGNRQIKQLWLTDRCQISAIGVASLLHRLHENQNLQKLRLSMDYSQVDQNELNRAKPLLRIWPANKPRLFQLEFHEGLRPIIDLIPKR